jgi:hypothetical protein
MRIARWMAGFLIGYAIVVLVTEFGFRALPGGSGSLAVGALQVTYATLVAVVAGLGGGAAGAAISGNRFVGAAIALPLLAETYWLFFLRKPPEPANLRDVIGAVLLISCTLIGAFARHVYVALRRRGDGTVAESS